MGEVILQHYFEDLFAFIIALWIINMFNSSLLKQRIIINGNCLLQQYKNVRINFLKAFIDGQKTMEQG